MLQVPATRAGVKHTTKTLKAGLIDGILGAEGYGEYAGQQQRQARPRPRLHDPLLMTKAVLRQQCQDAGAIRIARLNRNQLIKLWRRICGNSDDDEELSDDARGPRIGECCDTPYNSMQSAGGAKTGASNKASITETVSGPSEKGCKP